MTNKQTRLTLGARLVKLAKVGQLATVDHIKIMNSNYSVEIINNYLFKENIKIENN